MSIDCVRDAREDSARAIDIGGQTGIVFVAIVRHTEEIIAAFPIHNPIPGAL
jgi:hypothetical protein